MKHIAALSISIIVFLTASLIGYNFFIGEHARNTVQYKNVIEINLMNYDNDVYNMDIPLESTISEIKDPIREDYIFEGWFLDNSYSVPLNESSVLSDGQVLFAKWYSVPILTMENFFEQLENNSTLSYLVEHNFDTIQVDKFANDDYLFTSNQNPNIFTENITGMIYKNTNNEWEVSSSTLPIKELNIYKFLLKYEKLSNISTQVNNIADDNSVIKEYIISGDIDDEYSRKIIDGFMSEILDVDLTFKLSEGIYEKIYTDYIFNSSFEISIMDGEINYIDVVIEPTSIDIINKKVNVDPTEGLISYEIIDSYSYNDNLEIKFTYSDFHIDQTNINDIDAFETVQVTYNFLDIRVDNDSVHQPVGSTINLNNTAIYNTINHLLKTYNMSNFYGWYLDQSFSVPAEGHILESNTTVYANFNLLKQISDFIVSDHVLLEYIGDNKNIVIPANLRVKEISPNVFMDMDIESIILPEGIEIIGRSAFEDNIIEQLDMPSTITFIDDRAFYNNKIEFIDLTELDIDFFGEFIFAHNYIENITLSSQSEVIPKGMFYSNKITNISFSENIKDIREYAFHGNFITDLAIPSGISSINNYAFSNNSIQNLIIPDNILNINDFAFYGNKIDSLDIGPNVGHIGNYAFANNYLTYVEIPNNVSSLGDYSFMFNLLESISISSNLSNINDGTFQGNLLNNLDIPSNISSVGEGSFSNNLISNLNIPSTLTSIGHSAFLNSGINNLTFDSRSSDLNFGNYAFNGNNFDDLNIPIGVTRIESYAFSGINIINIYLPTTLTHIYSNAFRNSRIDNMSFNEGLISIGNSAFDNSNLVSVEMPSTLTNIGSYAFRNNSISEVILNEGLQTINRDAFRDNSISDLIFPSTLNTIRRQAFRNNNISEIVIPANVTSMERNIFTGNTIIEATIHGNHSRFISEYRDWSYYGIPNEAVS